ncbi:MAG: hypothetical protein JW943_03840 [Deltaproteobacteria bacterium]|nr:hypothetical protein [Deltaproteobacteria bacterium]
MTIGIHVKAGEKAYQIIKDGGFAWNRITTYFAPAGGPKWLIAGGFDLTLLKSGLLGNGAPILLVGASAGAWRFAAWIQPEAESSYRAFMEAYIHTSYKKNDTPQTVLKSLGDIINAYIADDALPFALNHKKYRLAVITARAKSMLGSDRKLLQMTGVGFFYLLNLIDRSRIYRLAERVVFYNAPKPPFFCLPNTAFKGRCFPLNETNFKHAIVASGALPIYVAGVRDIYGAPIGNYRDGGLIDYHLTHRFNAREDELTLFLHHQERIIPGWFDKKLKSRRPSQDALANVVMVYPTESFVAQLPNGKVPDREDFRTYLNDQPARVKVWQQAAAMAAPLGEQFVELMESGKIRDAVEIL